MNNIPFVVSLLTVLATFITVAFFYKAAGQSKKTLLILSAWLLLQTFPAINGFYTVTAGVPPRFSLLLGPPLIFIAVLFLTKKGKGYIDGLDIKWLTLLHSIRIIVEVILFWVFTYKTIPVVMTFEGRNFDILSGITAPVLYYFVCIKKQVDKKILLAWNFLCLGLLINIVVIAIISAPFAFQQLGFDQPNIAVLYFPFTWLPCCIVPLVLFSHLAAIRQLLYSKKANRNGS